MFSQKQGFLNISAKTAFVATISSGIRFWLDAATLVEKREYVPQSTVERRLKARGKRNVKH
jgi:hypothetical protein